MVILSTAPFLFTVFPSLALAELMINGASWPGLHTDVVVHVAPGLSGTSLAGCG